MSPNTIKATQRFVSEHQAGFTKFFTSAAEGPEISAAEVHVLVGLIATAQKDEGSGAMYGTRSLAGSQMGVGCFLLPKGSSLHTTADNSAEF